MNIFNLPDSLKSAIARNLIVGVIQFGSSLYNKNSDDIDLAVILKRNSYNKFLGHVNPDDFIGFDISLIKEEEIGDFKKFRFGSHGPHLGIPIKSGKVIFGCNPFIDFNIKDLILRESISIPIRIIKCLENII